MRAARTRTAPLVAAAAASFVVFLALGCSVARVPPGPADGWAGATFFGAATPLAAAVTRAGTFPYYALLGLAVLAFGALRRPWLSRAVLTVVVLLLAWQTSDAFKAFFRRARPPHMLVFQEASFSYPSGHTALATAFWGTLVACVVLAPSAFDVRKRVLLAVAALWLLVLGWSRLALGAHFLSDVLGGYALGGTFALLAAAVSVRFMPP